MSGEPKRSNQLWARSRRRGETWSLLPATLQEPLASVVTDRVGDRGADDVAEHAEDDDPGQRQGALEHVESGEQHRRLGTGYADDARAQREQGDARQPEAADHVRREIDQRRGQRGVGEQGPA